MHGLPPLHFGNSQFAPPSHIFCMQTWCVGGEKVEELVVLDVKMRHLFISL